MKAEIIAVYFFSSAVLSFGAAFVQQPAVTESNGKLKVDFSVSDQIDVEVAVIDRDNKVVRHLAAGVLGMTTPPPEPLKPGLTQSIEWNGLGDNGEMLSSSPYSIRVRLGVFLAFDKRISTKVYSKDAMSRLFYFNDTSKVYPGNLGPDQVISVDTFLPMTHPVWRQNSAKGGWDSTRIKFYEGSAKIDLTVSDVDDRIVMQQMESVVGGTTWAATIDGITGNVLNTWEVNDNVFWSFALARHGEFVFDWTGKNLLRDCGSLTNEIFRFTTTGARLNFSSGKNYFSMPKRTGSDLRQRGITTDRQGNIYHGHNPAQGDLNYPSGTSDWFVVSKHDSTGTVINDTLLKIYGNIGQGIRIDPKGNIFAGIRVRPKGDTVPKEIRSRLQGVTTDEYSQIYWAKNLYGSIAKFGPEGGRVVPDNGGTLMGGQWWGSWPSKAIGMQWMHFGASFQATHATIPGTACICYTPRFDVDGYGRVLFPNGFENEFKALDNNGNLIFRAHNRNFVEKIKIGLIHNVQVTDRAVYCADYINNQIVCFSWISDAEVILPVSNTAVEMAMHESTGLKMAASPNPSIGSIKIDYSLASAENASIEIYSVQGNLVKTLTGKMASGLAGSVQWNGRLNNGTVAAAGIYLAKLKNGSSVKQIKLVISK